MTTDLGTRPTTYRTGVVHQALLGLCAVGLVVTVIPLVVLQIPDAVAWVVVPPRVAAAGPGAVASLLRASGLALPAMAVAGSLAPLMVRWLRAGPELLSGLLILAASWAAFTVAGLAVAPEVMRHRVGAGDRDVALQPFPWLTGAALTLAALYALLAEGTATGTATAARFAVVCAVTGFTVSPAGGAPVLAAGGIPDHG